jgi:hypothetical protein
MILLFLFTFHQHVYIKKKKKKKEQSKTPKIPNKNGVFAFQPFPTEFQRL